MLILAGAVLLLSSCFQCGNALYTPGKCVKHPDADSDIDQDCPGDDIMEELQTSLLQVSVRIDKAKSKSEAGSDYIQARHRLGAALEKGESRPSEVEAYASCHLEQFSTKSAYYHLHFSKAGGTDFTDCAKLNGCVGGGLQVWVWSDLPLRGFGTFDKTYRLTDPSTCEDLANMYHDPSQMINHVKGEPQVMMNENYLPKAGLCPQYWNSVTFRNPVDRIVSMMYSTGLAPGPPTGEASFDPETVTPRDVMETIPISSNNFYIRSLLGEEVYNLPLGQINRTHLEAAKKVLDGFDSIFLMDSNMSVIRQYEAELGWQCDANATENSNWAPPEEVKDEFKGKLYSNWKSDDWDQMEVMNELDFELVSYANSIAHLDDLIFSHPSFLDAMSPRIPLEDCGYLSRANGTKTADACSHFISLM